MMRDKTMNDRVNGSPQYQGRPRELDGSQSSQRMASSPAIRAKEEFV
jgi:hypothetical protein